MAPYVIVKTDNAHMNIIVSTETKSRLFLSSASVLYRGLSGNYDAVETIEKLVMVMNKNDMLNSLQRKGREANKQLRKVCFQIFDLYGWDQDKYHVGFDWVSETSFDGISDETKDFLLEIINTGWYTMHTRNDFYTFVRNGVEGNLACKKHATKILLDMMDGIHFEEQMAS